MLDRLLTDLRVDPLWYGDRFPDVGLTGLEPAHHWEKYGSLLERDPRADLPLDFFRQTHRKHVGGSANKNLDLVQRVIGDGDFEADQSVVLKAAAEVVATHGYDLGLRLADQYLTGDYRPALNLLKANRAAASGSIGLWTTLINAYLDDHGLDQIAIDATRPQLIDRFMATSRLRLGHDGPRVSVLMPAFNAESTLAAAANSILNQTWANLELIVVDDASADGTWSEIQKLETRDPRVRGLRNSVNVGPYVSKNLALRLAKGDYITGQDADDWSHPQRIENQLNYLRSTGAPYALTSMLRVNQQMEITRLGKCGVNRSDGALSASFITLMIERPLMREIFGYWDSLRFAGDSELIHRIQTVDKRMIPRQQSLGLFAIEMADGLTNHPEHGYLQGPSPARQTNRQNAAAWHAGLDRRSAYMPFHHWNRHYPVHPGTATQPDDVEAVDRAAQDRIAPDRRIKTDVCIVTSLTFPGGNTSSTIDEIQTFIDAGLSVSIVHLPVAAHMRRLSKPPTADKYEPFRDRVFEWYDIETIECTHLIARHPRVITSPCFKRLLGKIDAGHLWYVMNNAQKHALGQDVYNPRALRRVVSSHLPERSAVVPISPAIRSELMALLPDVRLSDADWHPTFDAELYRGEVADHLSHPVVIGRHARDSVDKWLEHPAGLSAVYPDSDKYIVRILGGAAVATDILGSLPANWDVHPYGSLTAQDYLDSIDIFVNFPHSNLQEAFGRTVIEAIMHGRPAILPRSFEQNFGDLAYYCEPHEVEALIDRMVAWWPDIRRLQKAAQDLVLHQFASSAVKSRFPDLFATPTNALKPHPAGPPRLEDALSQMRRAFNAGIGSAR